MHELMLRLISQVLKNPWFLSIWVRHKIVIVLSLFCQKLLGGYVSQKRFRSSTPRVQVLPTYLTLSCLQWPKVLHLLHQNTGKLENCPLNSKCMPHLFTKMKEIIFKRSSCTGHHMRATFIPPWTDWLWPINHFSLIIYLLRWVIFYLQLTNFTCSLLGVFSFS